MTENEVSETIEAWEMDGSTERMWLSLIFPIGIVIAIRDFAKQWVADHPQKPTFPDDEELKKLLEICWNDCIVMSNDCDFEHWWDMCVIPDKSNKPTREQLKELLLAFGLDVAVGVDGYHGRDFKTYVENWMLTYQDELDAICGGNDEHSKGDVLGSSIDGSSVVDRADDSIAPSKRDELLELISTAIGFDRDNNFIRNDASVKDRTSQFARNYTCLIDALFAPPEPPTVTTAMIDGKRERIWKCLDERCEFNRLWVDGSDMHYEDDEVKDIRTEILWERVPVGTDVATDRGIWGHFISVKDDEIRLRLAKGVGTVKKETCRIIDPAAEIRSLQNAK